MAEAAGDLRARLRRIAPDEARRRNALLALLNGASTPFGPLAAAIDDAPPDVPLLRFTAGPAAAPLVVEGSPALWLEAGASPRLPEALVELGALEPLLAAAERRLGVPLDPEGVGAPASDGLRLRLSADGDGGGRHALSLHVPAALALPPPAPATRADLRRFGAATVRMGLRLRGRPAPVAELARLARGDVVLAEGDAGEIAAALAGPGGWGIVGRWRPRDGRFVQGGPMTDEPADAVHAEAGGAGAAPPDLRVRLTLSLGEVELTLADLAALAPGAVLAAPLAGDAPKVEVRAGGARLADGRLVALGEGYGVLIDRVAAAPSPGAAA